MRRLGCVLLAVGALAVFAGCSGRTTGASQITKQPDGSYSAKLNAVGSCERGSNSTPCTAYTRWREVGTSVWTNGPTIEVRKTVKDMRGSQAAKGLSPHTRYEYQVCGKEFSDERVNCVGPNGAPGTTQKFVTIKRSTAGRQKGQPAASPPGAETGASGRRPAGNTPDASNSVGDGGGTSPLVPIVIAVGAGALVLGGTWWAARRFRW